MWRTTSYIINCPFPAAAALAGCQLSVESPLWLLLLLVTCCQLTPSVSSLLPGCCGLQVTLLLHAQLCRRDVLRESARAEFEAARFEDDPEIVRQLPVAAWLAVPCMFSLCSFSPAKPHVAAPLAAMPPQPAAQQLPHNSHSLAPCASILAAQPAAGGGARCSAPRGGAVPSKAATAGSRCRGGIPSGRRWRRI